MKGIISEFKKFIARGNVIDLAVGVVMGTAFGKIVSSLVDNIIMPLVGILVGQNFATLNFVVNGSPIYYGAFIQSIVDFFIIAICVFLFVKVINVFFKKKEEKKEEKPTKEEQLLTEIRDLLKDNKKAAK